MPRKRRSTNERRKQELERIRKRNDRSHSDCKSGQDPHIHTEPVTSTEGQTDQDYGRTHGDIQSGKDPHICTEPVTSTAVTSTEGQTDQDYGRTHGDIQPGKDPHICMELVTSTEGQIDQYFIDQEKRQQQHEKRKEQKRNYIQKKRSSVSFCTEEKKKDSGKRSLKRLEPNYKSEERKRDTEAKRCKRSDRNVHLKESARDRAARKEKRSDCGVRKNESARETPARREKRSDSDVRVNESARETQARREKRSDSDVRKMEAARDRAARREKRNDSDVRANEATRETPARQEKRSDSDVRKIEAARDRAARNEKRSESDVRKIEAARDRAARSEKRSDSDVRKIEAARDRAARSEKRSDSDVQKIEVTRDRAARSEKRSDSDVRKIEAARDRAARSEKRSDSDVRKIEAARDRAARSEKRSDSDVRANEATRETPARQEMRSDSDVRANESARETPARKRKRCDRDVREKESARETPARKKKRSLAGDGEIAIAKFKQEIQNGPTFVCTCCCRLLYRNSVVEFNEKKFEGCSDILLNTCRTQIDKTKEYICNNCKTSLKRNMIPVLSPANHMDLDEIPQTLQVLNNLEKTLISRRIPFMKMMALPRGKQKSIHGCVVNIPVEPENSVSVLPRVSSPETMVLVKVKRKLQYRGHAFKNSVHPKRVKDALYVLKHSVNNPFYSDVVVDDDWEQNCANSDQELWSALTSENMPDQVNVNDVNNNIVEEKSSETESDEEKDDERSRLSGLQYDSCLQPKDITSDANFIISVAPGEGKRPKSFAEDASSEEMSFPEHFPSGKFGFSMPRPQKLTLKKYFQARMLHHDGRFARDPEYLFFAQYRCEAKEIHDCLSVALRKGRDDNVTVGDIRQRVSDIIHSDLGIHFLQKVRGSPAYFNKMLYDLLGMIRQLGPCTWFVTLSAADLKWHDTIRIIAEQQGKVLIDDEIDNLSWEQRSDFLRSNPVTAARHFNNRVQIFLKHILLNKELQPLGEITDYKYRIEFQQRGSPHVHMLAWVKDPPSFESNSAEEIQEFIDQHITCMLPEEDEHLKKALLHVQMHTHSVACRKHGKVCRFQFPRWPVRKTLALKPLEEAPSKSCQQLYTETLDVVYKQLENIGSDNQTTLYEVLAKARVREQVYMKALHWMKTKKGQPAILLKRSPCEASINNYNPTIMKCWEANLDVQFVTNTFACVMYVASYVSKPEKTLGDVLKAVSKSSVSLGPKSSMKTVARKFLTHREVSAQEATFRLLSLPLVQGSRQIVFIPTDLPQHRTRLIKPLKLLQQLEDDDTDVFMTGLLDRYAARPKSLEKMFLADFAAKLKYFGTKKPGNHPDEETGPGSSDERTPTEQCVVLQKEMGSMIMRKLPAIIRSHQWSKEKQPEQYYHSQLLLYFPWRDETRDLLSDSFQNSYIDKLETIQVNRCQYQKHAEEVTMAFENLEQAGDPEEAWNVLAPQTEQARVEAEDEGQQVVDSVLSAFEPTRNRTVSADIGFPQYEVEFTTEKMTTTEYYELVNSLNRTQSELHQFVVDWCSRMLLTHRVHAPEPFHIFLTGGAGVGKSHVVRAIVQTASRVLRRNNQVDQTHVLVSAPTGAAAYNVSGYTLHSAFHLPLNCKATDDYIPLSGEKMATLKEAIGSTKIIVIDEVSMVGADMLLTVHRRLCDVMANEEPFGGVSVLAVGDLLQLPPVAQKAVFSCPSDDLAAIYGSLWQNHFKIIELTEIQRQKGDASFADLLNRVRTGSQTDEDMATLRSKHVEKQSPDYPADTTHIFAYNKNVADHNLEKLKSLVNTVYVFNAQDSKKDEQTGSIDTANFTDMSGGLCRTLSLAVGARVMLVKNIDVSDGLVNSAVGTVTGFIPAPPCSETETFKPKYVLVKFDDDRVGKRSRLLTKCLLPDGQDTSTPIPTVESQIKLGRYSKVTAKRTQFPLTLAWGITIHKEQGKTEDRLVVSCEGSFHPGQFYTAVSRTKDLKGLFFLDKVSANKIKVNVSALKEIERMKKTACFTPVVPASIVSSMDMCFKLQCLNVNSLKPHWESLCKDNYLATTHVSCLTDTWMKTTESSPSVPDHTTLMTTTRSGRGGGLAMFIHDDMHLLRQYVIPNIKTEHQLVILSPKLMPSFRICILSLYHNTKLIGKHFLPELEKLIAAIPEGLTAFVLGDFNIDSWTSSHTATNLQKLMNYYGFIQYVQIPTHRRGGRLDHLYCNRMLDGIHVDTIPTYYSDHFLISAAVPWNSLFH